MQAESVVNDLDECIVMGLVACNLSFLRGGIHSGGGLAVLESCDGPPAEEAPDHEYLALCSYNLLESSFVTRLDLGLQKVKGFLLQTLI